MKPPETTTLAPSKLSRMLGWTGFTLIELLTALVVFSISALALFSLGSTTIKGNTRNENESVAMALAISKMEELRNKGFTSPTLASGSDGPMGADGVPGSGIYSRAWTVTATTLTGVTTAAKALSVSVSWTGGGTLTLNSLVVNPSEVTPGFMVGFPTAAIKSWEQSR